MMGRRVHITTVLFALTALGSIASTGRAQPPESITTCTKLTKAGLYVLDPSSTQIQPSVPGDCFVISRPNISLNLNGVTLAGLGSGVGVHLTSSASNVLVEGRGSTISGFSEGIEIDGSKNIAENFIVTGNSDVGVLLNNVKQTRLNNFTASMNGSDGVRIYKGSYNSISGAAYPGVNGAVTVAQNARYGIWLSNTGYNSVGGFTAENNNVAGVYIGCSSSFPQSCSKTTKSKYNTIFDGYVIAVNEGSQPYGVAIDAGDDNNRVADVSSLGENIDAVTDDFIDQNSDCGTDDWFSNVSFSGKTMPTWVPTGCMD